MSKKYIKVEIKEVDDLPEAGLYFCAITDDCYGSFHYSPDDKDSVDFWIGNVMWYLIEEPEQSSQEELKEENLHKAINFINRYYRHVSGRKECVGFHMKYIQPMCEFINQHKTTTS